MKKLSCTALDSPTLRHNFAAEVSQRLPSLPLVSDGNTTVDEGWKQLAEVVRGAAQDVVGYANKKNKDWFDDNSNEVKNLLDSKNKGHAARNGSPNSVYLRERWRNLRAQTQRCLRDIENQWWLDKAAEIQRYADSNDQQNFYSALKQVYVSRSHNLAPVRTTDPDGRNTTVTY